MFDYYKETLSEEQLDIVEKIYNAFKTHFPNVEIQPRKVILGIGEKGKYLMCYFKIEDNSFFIKFKNYPPILYYHNLDLSKFIEETILLFENNDFTLKQNNKKETKRFKNCLNSDLIDKVTFEAKKEDKSTKKISKEPKFLSEDSKEYALFNTFNTTLEMIDNEKGKNSFDSCSNRLRNALYRNYIFTINDLKLYEFEDVLKLRSFGVKCLEKLCEFLTQVKNQNKINEIDERTRQKYSMLGYIKEIRNKTFSLDMQTAYIDYMNDKDTYRILYSKFIEFFTNAIEFRLESREQSILCARLGINEEPKTLQKIATANNLTRERIRQIVNKSIRKLKPKSLLTYEIIEYEFERCKLIEELSKFPAGGFIAYLYFECDIHKVLPSICLFIFDQKVDLNLIEKTLSKQENHYGTFLKYQEKQKKFNGEIFKLLRNQNMRKIPEEAFSRLKTEKKVNTRNPELTNFDFDNKFYTCESYLQKNVLKKLLYFKTFKYIKTHSLKIPYKDSYYYPDFQCLTNDNEFVIIEVKSLLKMCEYENIKKFKALKAYCKKYKFGYLIIDDMNNEFFHIKEEGVTFSRVIMGKLKKSKKITYSFFLNFYEGTNANLKHLLALIKKEKLQFSIN